MAASTSTLTFAHGDGMGEVAKAIVGSATVRAVPDEFNGDPVATDLMSPMTTVDEENLLVITGNGRIDLRASIGYAIWIGQKKPAEATVVTDAHLAAALPRVSHILTIYSLHKLAHMASVDVRIRTSDTLPTSSYAAHAGMGATSRAADVLFTWCTANDRNRAKASADKQMVTLAVVATAIHRKIASGHNWLTGTMNDPRSVASRAIGVGGPLRKELKTFMQVNGHDLWHHLSNDSLDSLACGLVGDDSSDAKPFAANTSFGGAAIGGSSLAAVVQVGEAATERYPVGTLGKAALMTGMSCMVAMITSISFKIHAPEAGQLIASIEGLRGVVGSKGIQKPAITAIKATMGSAVAMAGGYSSADVTARLLEPLSPSLAAFCESRPTDRDTGKALHATVRNLVTDPGAAGGAIVAALNAMASALRSTNSEKIGADRILGDVTLMVPSAISPVTIADDPAAVASRENHSRMMELIEAMK